jgi:hypothetical protein
VDSFARKGAQQAEVVGQVAFEGGAGDDFFEVGLVVIAKAGFEVFQVRVVFVQVIARPLGAGHLYRHLAVQFLAGVAGIGLDYTAIEAAKFHRYVAVVDLDVFQQVGVQRQALAAARDLIEVVVAVARVQVVVHAHAVNDKQVLPGPCAVDADIGRGNFARVFAAQLAVVELHIGVGAQQAGDISVARGQVFDHLAVDHLFALEHRLHRRDGCAFDLQHIALGRRQDRGAVSGGHFPLHARAAQQAGQGFFGAGAGIERRAGQAVEHGAFRADLPARLLGKRNQGAGQGLGRYLKVQLLLLDLRVSHLAGADSQSGQAEQQGQG